MKKLVIALVFLTIIFSIANMIISYSFLSYFPTNSISSRGITGVISFFVEGSGLSFSIISPGNTTYSFSKGDSYIISLNISSEFEPSNWTYVLHDLRHNTIINQSVVFAPNTTIIAIRWNNNLTVYANRLIGNPIERSVTFFVSVPNSAPLIENISTEYLACEDSSLYTNFYASDVDEDSLTAFLSPLNPFYATQSMTSINLTSRKSDIFSGTLSKSNIGRHQEILSVSDGSLSDSRYINITVIEINHAPSISHIGAHTLYTVGDNSTFNYTMLLSDLENGNNASSGNFSYNLTFLSGTQFVYIDNSGFINGSANSSLIGVYNISVCVNDSGLSSPHANITNVCGSDGGSLRSCINFSLTVTDVNRAPTIVSFYTTNTTPVVSGNGSMITLSITKHDPDGTIPDTYWYSDNSLKEIDSGNLSDSYSQSFSACSREEHIVKGVITDGLANDSIQWNITVIPDSVCAAAVGGGGGSGGGILTCTPLWGCNSWTECRYLESALKKGDIFGEDYREIQRSCAIGGYSEARCGFQTRSCIDTKMCNSTLNKQKELDVCYYVSIPGCTDGVKNCHNNSCEVLIDCGGPCASCASCSDKIQNQGEEGVDCGGPCNLCKPEELKQEIKFNIYLVLIITALFILAIMFIIRILRFRKLLKIKPLDRF